MINSHAPPDRATSRKDENEDEAVAVIVRAGPGGAIVLAALATAIVVALWFAFYLVVFLPRATP